MSGFQALVALRTSDDETAGALRAVRDGPPAAREAALAALTARARSSGDPDAWAAAALGHHFAGRHGEARRILGSLVDRFPDVDAFRLDLAASYSQVESVELCRYHLGYLAAHGSTDEWRALGRRQLEGYEDFVGLTDARRQERERELAALREATARQEGEAAHAIELARLLMRKHRVEPASGAFAEAAAVLERAREAFPDDVRVLEMLVGCYTHHDPGGRLDEVRASLERLAPASPVLRILAEASAAPEWQVNDLRGRADELLQTVGSSTDGALRQAAVADLARMVASFPDNPHYRLRYAWALMVVGPMAAGVEQAMRLAHIEGGSHEFHFNLAQVLWRGDVAAARRHLALAHERARNDEQRRDVVELAAQLGAPPP